VPERTNLENIRKGQFEGIRAEIETNPARKPDFGEAKLHPTAGATVVGARKFLIAYNVFLNTPAESGRHAYRVQQLFEYGDAQRVRTLKAIEAGKVTDAKTPPDLVNAPV